MLYKTTTNLCMFFIIILFSTCLYPFFVDAQPMQSSDKKVLLKITDAYEGKITTFDTIVPASVDDFQIAREVGYDSENLGHGHKVTITREDVATTHLPTVERKNRLDISRFFKVPPGATVEEVPDKPGWQRIISTKKNAQGIAYQDTMEIYIGQPESISKTFDPKGELEKKEVTVTTTTYVRPNPAYKGPLPPPPTLPITPSPNLAPVIEDKKKEISEEKDNTLALVDSLENASIEENVGDVTTKQKEDSTLVLIDSLENASIEKVIDADNKTPINEVKSDTSTLVDVVEKAEKVADTKEEGIEKVEKVADTKDEVVEKAEKNTALKVVMNTSPNLPMSHPPKMPVAVSQAEKTAQTPIATPLETAKTSTIPSTTAHYETDLLSSAEEQMLLQKHFKIKKDHVLQPFSYFMLVPDPNRGFWGFRCDTPLKKAAIFAIYNTEGRMVHYENIPNFAGTYYHIVKAFPLTKKGDFFVIISQEEQHFCQKVRLKPM